MDPMTHFASAHHHRPKNQYPTRREQNEAETRRTLKVLRIRHKRRATPRAPILLIHRIRPIPTQRDIQHNLVIKKVLLDTALIPILEYRRRLAPRLRTWLLVHNILRNGAAREVPHLDRVLVPRVCVHPAGVDVEVVSVGRVCGLCPDAARVRGGGGGAQCADEVAGGGVRGLGERAGRAGVCGDLVRGHFVHALCIVCQNGD